MTTKTNDKYWQIAFHSVLREVGKIKNRLMALAKIEGKFDRRIKDIEKEIKDIKNHPNTMSGF